VNVSVLAQVPFVVRVPVSEYVADVARDELVTKKVPAITVTRAKSATRSFIAFQFS
jgi:precorrin isomerase